MRRFPGHAQQHVALAQLVLAAVGVEHLADFAHHLRGLHGRRGLHGPGEAQRARLDRVLLAGDGGRGASATWRSGEEEQ